jgi:hypothetical protein
MVRGRHRCADLLRRPSRRSETQASAACNGFCGCLWQTILNFFGRAFHQYVASRSLRALEAALLIARRLALVSRTAAIFLPCGTKWPWSPDPSTLWPSCHSSRHASEIPLRCPSADLRPQYEVIPARQRGSRRRSVRRTRERVVLFAPACTRFVQVQSERTLR